MGLVALVVRWILSGFLLCLFARVLLSYFPIQPGTMMAGVARFVGAVTDPILLPVRRIIPPIGGGSGVQLDLSPIVVFFLCFILLALI